MINIDELKNYKNILNLNLGQTEKNYIHTAILFSISKLFPEKFIFKGGTCLMICYNIDRFSEDLDFNLTEDIDIEYLLSNIRSFLNKYNINIDYNIIKKKHFEDCFIYFYGPLFKNTNNTRCKIKLDFSKRKDYKKTNIIKVNHIYNEFPVFYIKTLSLSEIFSEKIRAIMERNKSRDLYDLNYLINRNVELDLNLINYKLSLYNKKFNLKDFIFAVNNKQNIWDKEMKNLVSIYPSFDDISKSIIDFVESKIK
jgi:uncharacterized protein